MNLILRALGIPEALQHEALLDEALGESSEALGQGSLPAGSARRLLESAAGRDETLVVGAGEEGGPPVAVCLAVPLEEPLTRASVPLIVALYVAPALRNRGIARTLVGEVRRLFSVRGIHTLSVRAGHNDDALISMGERWGFVRRWELLAYE